MISWLVILLLKATCIFNNISFMLLTAHRCAGGMKKKVDVCRGHKYQMAKTHKTYSLRDSCIITDKFPYLTKMRICHILRNEINNACTRRCALNLYFDSLADL